MTLSLVTICCRLPICQYSCVESNQATQRTLLGDWLFDKCSIDQLDRATKLGYHWYFRPCYTHSTDKVFTMRL